VLPAAAVPTSQEQRKLEASIARASATLSRYVIGQRVRTIDGRVGTVANIQIAGKSSRRSLARNGSPCLRHCGHGASIGATRERGPGLLLRLSQSEAAFVGPHELMGPYDIGRLSGVQAMPAAERHRLGVRAEWLPRPAGPGSRQTD
jgi:hypothetical protein